MTCCDKDLVFEDLEEHCIILNFYGKITVNICDRKTNSGVLLFYRSHIKTNTDLENQSFFRYNNQVYTQKNSGVYRSYFGNHESVKTIAIYVSRNIVNHIFEDVQNFIYDQQILLKLHRQYWKHLKPELFEEKQRLIREKDIARNASEKRKFDQKEVEKKRSKTPSRIEYEQKRNKSSERIESRRETDKKRSKTSSRITSKKESDRKGSKNSSRIALKKESDRKRSKTSSRIA